MLALVLRLVAEPFGLERCACATSASLGNIIEQRIAVIQLLHGKSGVRIAYPQPAKSINRCIPEYRLDNGSVAECHAVLSASLYCFFVWHLLEKVSTKYVSSTPRHVSFVCGQKFKQLP